MFSPVRRPGARSRAIHDAPRVLTLLRHFDTTGSTMSTATETLTRTKITEPSMWAVMFHNDDYTPFDFVVAILERFFNMSEDTAREVADKVHKEGQAKIGRYTKEIAETKVSQVTALAARNGHPLKVTPEEA
jgi:ATP-dependent Clp protease adaptor protein ClpS